MSNNITPKRSLFFDGCTSTSKYATKRFNRLREPLARTNRLDDYVAELESINVDNTPIVQIDQPVTNVDNPK